MSGPINEWQTYLSQELIYRLLRLEACLRRECRILHEHVTRLYPLPNAEGSLLESQRLKATTVRVKEHPNNITLRVNKYVNLVRNWERTLATVCPRPRDHYQLRPKSPEMVLQV